MSTYSYEATVLRVVDGDTVDLAVDLGFRIVKRDRFRLAGIDAPERGQEGWSEASKALAEMIPAGSRVSITTYHPTSRDPKDKYGRWLATIHTPELGDLNRKMVEAGFAKDYGA